jgi:hypothetical protein
MRRSLLALALAVPLLSQPALVDTFWTLLSEVWGDEGCGADPSGRCAATPQLEVDAGCGADPSGGPKCSS